ncbi:carnitine dehydratase [Alkalihalophilus pseudofirmus]|uniref:CaiB/BaiF CoA transferase family protein n=1 Tax=Alkalihalobacterium alkalinitrilicum TaxID=427920 RepID=UPI00094C4D17|nr:CaiB/BaiF CoA-transferase family protein [Alkalihalobacterium alkalinitrilicum]OLO36968.1 carnitine dehydratase [Alkalihalophilus pseudofirmus]
MTLPLENIRVLDLSRLLPGPFCTLTLADFGADVIKVEDPKVGDYARWNEPQVEGQNHMFLSLNRNKRSVTLDLKSEKGKQLFKQLVETSDILVESFRPGVMDRLGLGYETLKEINPKLIYCAITGFGQTGPYSQYPGHDINYLSYAGLLGQQGEQNRKPVSSSTQIADIGGGAQMATNGILLALLERHNSGKGQFVDISMLDGSVSWLQTLLPDYLATKNLPERGESVLNGGLACYEIYETKDDRFLSVGALEPKFWVEFCKVIEREDLIPLLEAPLEQQNQMKKDIQSILKQKTLEEWTAIFEGVDACVAPLLNFDEVAENPQVVHRQLIQEIYDPKLGKIQQIGVPIKLSETPGEIRFQAPKLGEHNSEVFAELGYSSEEIKELNI